MSTETLLPCPCCGGEARLTKGHATERVWPHGDFHRVYCTVCQLRQLFFQTPGEAAEAWNRRPVARGVKNPAQQGQENYDRHCARLGRLGYESHPEFGKGTEAAL